MYVECRRTKWSKTDILRAPVSETLWNTYLKLRGLRHQHPALIQGGQWFNNSYIRAHCNHWNIELRAIATEAHNQNDIVEKHWNYKVSLRMHSCRSARSSDNTQGHPCCLSKEYLIPFRVLHACRGFKFTITEIIYDDSPSTRIFRRYLAAF